MLEKKSLVARALEIAPECETNKAVRARLRKEGYTLFEIQGHLEGKGLRQKLKALRSAGKRIMITAPLRFRGCRITVSRSRPPVKRQTRSATELNNGNTS
jgi:hypothetical protein